MKFIYPAVFHEEKDGKYKGYFPDLECCYGEGDTIDDAIDDANEAAKLAESGTYRRRSIHPVCI